MRKIIIASSGLLLLLMIIFGIKYTVKLNDKEIIINGTTYALTIDGEKVSSIPTTGNYYLTSYTCENGSIVTWENKEHNLYINAIDENGNEYIQIDSCTLEFSTTKLLNTMKVGDYVAYEGDPNNGCLNGATGTTGVNIAESGNSCKGENPNQPAGSADDRGVYGYCSSEGRRYITYGWRIAYIEDEKVNLISAGSPECRSRTSSNLNKTQINDLNEAALKYCNKDYVDGGECPTTPSEDNNVRALGDKDFAKITYAISGISSNLTEDTHTYENEYCLYQFSEKRCGYGNDLIDNGGNYWFAANDDHDGIGWSPNSKRVVGDSTSNNYSGLRPVITLSSSVYVTGGSGTMEDPWEIAIDTN